MIGVVKIKKEMMVICIRVKKIKMVCVDVLKYKSTFEKG
jgi:hypothetical protein